MSLKQKQDSSCDVFNFSLVFPNPNNFLLVCMGIVNFHDICSPTYLQTFCLRGIKFFLIPFSQGLGP